MTSSILELLQLRMFFERCLIPEPHDMELQEINCVKTR